MQQGLSRSSYAPAPMIFDAWVQILLQVRVFRAGIADKAQIGLKLLKDSIEEFAGANPKGITNSDSAHFLGLQSDNDGKQQDYLTYSALGMLIREGRIKSIKEGSRRKYKSTKHI